MERRNAWLSYKEAEETEMEKLAKAYREFLDKGKTERECVAEIVKEAEVAGYESLESKLEKGEKIKAGDKVYAVGMKKIVALFHVGTEELSGGMSILCAHIDSPRLDVKQNPLYEDTDLAYLDTHYYGGVKKYQWVTLPLAMHGVVAKKDGSIVEISIGENAEDPVLYITDLLIHLSVIYHIYNTDRIALYKHKRNKWLVAQNKHIKRISVVCKRLGDKSVVCGIMCRCIQYSVEYKHSRLLVKLVL